MPLFRTYKVLFISRIMKDKLSHKPKLSKSIGKKMTFLFPLTVAGLFASFGHSLQQMHELLLHIHSVFLTLLFRSCDLPGPCCMSCWPGLSQDSISWRCGVSVNLLIMIVCVFVCLSFRLCVYSVWVQVYVFVCVCLFVYAFASFFWKKVYRLFVCACYFMCDVWCFSVCLFVWYFI